MISGHRLEAISTGSGRARSTTSSPIPTTIDGLWVLLTANDGVLPDQDSEGRVPVLAQASNGKHYLLVYKSVVKAKQCIAEQQLDDAEPRMIVRGNKDEVIRVASSGKVAGALLDFEPATGGYAAIMQLA